VDPPECPCHSALLSSVSAGHRACGACGAIGNTVFCHHQCFSCSDRLSSAQPSTASCCAAAAVSSKAEFLSATQPRLRPFLLRSGPSSYDLATGTAAAFPPVRTRVRPFRHPCLPTNRPLLCLPRRPSILDGRLRHGRAAHALTSRQGIHGRWRTSNPSPRLRSRRARWTVALKPTSGRLSTAFGLPRPHAPKFDCRSRISVNVLETRLRDISAIPSTPPPRSFLAPPKAIYISDSNATFLRHYLCAPFFRNSRPST